tara:strand:- start:521 stop:778 length:258 start_codon:yes stop_codon:yes gene_type:complete
MFPRKRQRLTFSDSLRREQAFSVAFAAKVLPSGEEIASWEVMQRVQPSIQGRRREISKLRRRTRYMPFEILPIVVTMWSFGDGFR